MQPAERQPDDSLERIVAVGTKHFALYGYHGISMREIAAAAGLSKPGLYHHVASKSELLLAVLDAGLAGLVPAIERLRDRSVPWLHRLERWITEIVSLTPDQSSIIRIGKEAVHLDEQSRKEFSSKYYRQFIGPISNFLLEGEELGLLAQDIAGVGLWSLLGMLTAFLEGEGGAKALGMDTPALAKRLVGIVLNGLAVRNQPE